MKARELKIDYDKITSEFAYTLGTILTDGYIDKKLTEITLEVIDNDFAKEFKYNIEKWSGLKCTTHKYKTDHKDVYRVILSSKNASHFLKEYDYNNIKNSDDICKCYFLRAVFDAEGSVSFQKLKKPYSPIRTIDMCSINYDFIIFVKDLLKDINIDSREIRIAFKKGETNGYGEYKSNLYELVIGKRKDLEIFNTKVGFTIRRKQIRVDKFLQTYKGVTKDGVKLSWNTGLTKETNKKLKEVGRKIALSMLKNG